jgi:zinc transport system substrate-binding protein
MIRAASLLRVLLALLALGAVAAVGAQPLRIGVTLHPYYSWVANIVGDRAEIVPLIPSDADPHSYQIRPEDVARIRTLDVVVVNGLGHDEFAEPLLEAAGRRDIARIRPNEGVPQLRDANGGVNPHTFLSITSAAQQVANIAEALGRMDPANAGRYATASTEYRARLRGLLGAAVARLPEGDLSTIRIATVHDGYLYLLQDLGLTVAAVIQPRHGIEPSARQLADTVSRLKRNGIDILFAEADYGGGFAEVVARETGARVYKLSHVSAGPYRADAYERAMRANFDAVVEAVRAVYAQRHGERAK